MYAATAGLDASEATVAFVTAESLLDAFTLPGNFFQY